MGSAAIDGTAYETYVLGIANKYEVQRKRRRGWYLGAGFCFWLAVAVVAARVLSQFPPKL
jgi:hypothetical protein